MKNDILSDIKWEMEKGHMFSMIGNLSPEDKPFKVGDRVYFKGVGLFSGEITETLIIEKIKYGKGGYMVFKGEKSGEIAKKGYDEVFDQYNLIRLKNN